MRRPWWLWLATASFIAYWIFLRLSLYYGREPAGFTHAPPTSGITITAVEPGSPADRGGMREGDRIVSAFGLPVIDQIDEMAMGANVPIGVPTEWIVERGGTPVTLTLPPMSRGWSPLPGPLSVVTVALFISLVLGLLLAWRGDGRPTTLLGACLLASLACATMPLWPRSMAAELRASPWPLVLLIWPAAISSIVSPVMMFAFCALVPRPLMKPGTLAIALAPIALLVIFVSLVAILIVHDPVGATEVPLPLWLGIAGPLSYGVYFGASAILLLVSMRSARDPNDRRRAQVLMIGIASGALGLFAIAGTAVPGMRISDSVFAAGAIAFCLLPIAFAYATLRHRLFDIRVIVRLGLQYALARGAIIALVPITIAALVIDVLIHGEQPLQRILADRGWTYAVVAAVIGLIYWKRGEWMAALDRRFFRERYAAQQILKEVVADMGTSESFQAAAAKVVSRIDSALHPALVAVMTRPHSATAFSVAAKRPELAPLSPLQSGHAITQVVRALNRPVVFGPKGLRDLPPDQQAWLAASNVEVVIPITTAASKDEAMMVLGPRRSEEPYSGEDLDLLATVGASLGLLIGTTSPSDAPTITTDSPMPRLANRYRIERPIGEGGMGVVFAAVDETLERPVAIKVIKDQHLTGDGLARFQREARTAASLSHPNIVTVHDFGVDDAGSPYLVMELLKGRSLREAIKKDGPMPAARALQILTGLYAAIEAAHASGVVHRDLKPENVFLIGNGTHAKVLDYGIAKIAGATSATGATSGVIGTLAYMAPEQAAGGEASPAWDLWAASVIVFETLTGQHPFNGGLPVTRAIPVKTLLPDISDDMAAAIDKALSLSPSERPGTTNALLTSLTRQREL